MSVAVYTYADGSEHVIVQCDTHACPADLAAPTYADLDQLALVNGWTVFNRHHYCPEHAP